ncbi:MAG: hypothetical protein MJZ55_00155 [Paludibacteraceae bacterium]|nr:hypothetical protein [Paludibacteraceae bacterium]
MLDRKSYLIGLSGGGGGEPITEEINITANGTYTPREGVDGYNKVGVNVKPLLKMDYTWRNYGGGNHVTVNAGGGYTGTGYANYDGFGTPFMISIPPERMLQHAPTITENGTYRPEWGKVVYDLRTKDNVLYQVDVLLESREEFDNLPPYQDAILALPCIQEFMASHGLTAADVSYVGMATIADVKWPLLIDGWMPQITVDVAGSEPLVLSGDCSYAFYGEAGQKIIEAGVKAENVSNAKSMFSSTPLRELPEISFADEVNNINNMFYSANYIREIPYDFNIKVNGDASYIFRDCYSLRQVPQFYKNIIQENSSASYSPYNYGFCGCNALDEITDIPVVNQNYTSASATSKIVNNCYRIARFTFEQNKTARWKAQMIDLVGAGYAPSYQYVAYNSGITADKEVKNAATYEALKNDADWFTCNSAYSRYNKTSAVETINSLPDTSAYLATAGGKNTIRFTGAAGSATDGGAINTLTEAEIAVAAAKGWTVTFA